MNTSYATLPSEIHSSLHDDVVTSNISYLEQTNREKFYIQISQTFTMVVVVIIMFGLGCSIDVKVVWGHLKSPKQFATGIALQLLLMPVLGYSVTRILGMTIPESLGVLFQSIVPGGTYSNLITYWLDGDMDLSVLMTSASTLMAIGTMPLWLLIFTKLLSIDKSLQVPFKSLGIALASVGGPVIAGTIFRHFFPKIATKTTKAYSAQEDCGEEGNKAKYTILTGVCTIVGTMSIAALMPLLILGGAFNYPLSYRTIVAAFMMSSVAVVLGYLASRVPCLEFTVACRRTIAIETVYQSTPVAFSIVVLSFSPADPEVFGPMAFYPILYGLVQISSSFVIVAVYKFLVMFGVKWVLPTEPLEGSSPTNLDKRRDDQPKVSDNLLNNVGDQTFNKTEQYDVVSYTKQSLP